MTAIGSRRRSASSTTRRPTSSPRRRLRRVATPCVGVHQPDRHERDRRRRLHAGQQRGAGDRDGHRGRGPGHPDRQRPRATDNPTPTWTFSVPAQLAFRRTSRSRGELPVLDRPRGSRAGPRARRRQPHASRAAGGRQLHVPGPRRIGSNTDPTPVTRDFTVSTADMELVSNRRPGSGVRGRDPHLHVPPATTAPDGRDARSWTSCRPGRAMTRARSRAPTHRDGDLRARDAGRRRGPHVHDHVLIAATSCTTTASPLTITNTATADSDRNDRDPTNDQQEASQRLSRPRRTSRSSASRPRTRRPS